MVILKTDALQLDILIGTRTLREKQENLRYLIIAINKILPAHVRDGAWICRRSQLPSHL